MYETHYDGRARRRLYQIIARWIYGNQTGIGEWIEKFLAAAEILPSGSGIDAGTTIDLAASTPDRIVLTMSFHHMNDGGFYDGWTDHTIVVRPSLAFGVDLRVTGRNRNEIKDYLHDVYALALREYYYETAAGLVAESTCVAALCMGLQSAAVSR